MLTTLLLALCPSPTATETPLHVFLRGGAKTHGPDQHEHEKWVGEWRTLLESRGAAVEGALRFPTAEELARTDVLVLYAAEAGSVHGRERENLEAYLARGGGIVAIHDAVCGDDPQYWKTVLGGSWEHGRAKWHEGTTDLYFTDRGHPVSAGIANFRFEDELYTDLHVLPEARVLVRGFHSVFDASPQAWVYEARGHRAFVAIQGHEWSSFAHPAWRTLLLRGIAWAGKRDAELLTAPAERAGLSYPPGGPLAPELAARALEVHPDFDLALVVAEPLIASPISLDWDARGRMWVAETPGYPEKQHWSGVPAHDEIAILSDADGDGRMDRKQVFFRGLDLVTSLVFHQDGVLVAQAPEILFLRDADGDDVAEERQVVFRGFGFGDTHAVISNLRWGPDGWVYGTQGYSGGDSRHVTNAAGRDFGHIGNGLFRFRPDGSAIEMVSNYGSNTWGCDFDEEGELFFSMANGAHLRHVVVPERVFEGGRLGRVESWADCPDHDRVVPLLTHADPAYAQIDFVGGFTAASGCTIYDGGAWPGAEWARAHFVAEPTVHLVHHDVLRAKGAGFEAVKAREAEFLAGRDLWFRPVHMRTGPDGALYVLDFYNQAVVHNDTRGPEHGPTNFARRPDRDHEHGRIWRVQHKQATRLARADLGRAGERELVGALESPNGWTRQTAVRLIAERARPIDLAPALRSASEPGRIAAQWARARLSGFDAATWKLAATDASPALRRTAARIASECRPTTDASVRPQLVALLRDEDARTRLLALVALGDVGASDEALHAVVQGWPGFADPWTRNAALRALATVPIDAVENALEGSEPGRRRDLALELVRRESLGDDPSGCCRLVMLLAARDGRDPELMAELLDAIRVRAPTDSDACNRTDALYHLDGLLRRPEVPIYSAAIRLAARWGMQDEFKTRLVQRAQSLTSVLLEPTASLDARLAALQTIVLLPDRREGAIGAAKGLFDPAAPLDEQLRVIDVLAAIDDPAVARTLAAPYASLSARAQDRIFEKLAARASWSAALLDEIEAGRFDARVLGTQKQHRLRNSPDAAVAGRATRILAGSEATAAGIEALIQGLLPEVELPGDAASGKALFAEHCGPCHAANGEGGAIGPDLTGMGSHGARDLLPSILDPNRTVEPAFTEWSLTTKDDQLFAGILAREGSRSVLLRWNGGEQEVARSEIEALRNTGRSPMPVGLEKIGAAGLRDVIAYLSKGTEGFRVLSLGALCSRNSLAGIYDHRHANEVLRPARFGIVEVLGVPFEVLDPARTPSGNNVIVLKGGTQPDWDCKKSAPQRIEVPVGCAVQQVHVLGGIAAWGHPFHREKSPILRWTWKYADGTSEEVVLRNGVEFGDWIARNDVPGSVFVEGFLAGDSWGQVRFHSLAPGKPGPVASIVLESFDGLFAPTLLALTVELPGTPRVSVAKPAPRPPEDLDVLVFGGGSSHDFARWFGECDLATLAQAGLRKARFTQDQDELGPQLARTKVLVLCNNQPIEDAALRGTLLGWVERGGALLLVHPATWHNWPDWKAFNALLVGGGARSHEDYGEFDVILQSDASEILEDVPSSFAVKDELYRMELDSPGSQVLARGRSRTSGKDYPVLWTRSHGKGRIVGFTLGHDGAAHEGEPYRRLYQNAVRWLLESTRGN